MNLLKRSKGPYLPTRVPTYLECNAALPYFSSPSSSSLNEIGDNQKGHDHY